MPLTRQAKSPMCFRSQFVIFLGLGFHLLLVFRIQSEADAPFHHRRAVEVGFQGLATVYREGWANLDCC